MQEHEKSLPVSSSIPPQFPDEQKQLFRDVLQLFNDEQVPYVVAGTFALHEHAGIWRQTKDLDLFMEPQQVPAAMALLARSGFDTYVKDPVWIAKACRGEHFVDLITGMSNAVVKVDRSWIERGMPSTVLDIPVTVLGVEELIVSKIFVTRRERFDGADIAHLVYAKGGFLDWDRILSLIGENWELLLWSLVLFRYIYPAHTRAVPLHIWDKLIKRLRDEIVNPDVNANFRGSLIDENMFAIDVNEWGLRNVIEEYRAQHPEKLPSLTDVTA